MLKTITPFILADESTKRCLSVLSLTGILTAPTARDPEKTMWACVGFSRPEHFGIGTVFIGADDTRVLNVQIRERILPAKVIKTQVTERATELEKRQGYKCGRKTMAELKENVVMELLPNSHIRPTDIPVVITEDYLLIGTSSARQVDVVMGLLSGLFPDNQLSLRPLSAKRDVQKWITGLLLDDATVPSEFTHGDSVVLKSSSRSVARFKDMDLTDEDVVNRVVAGMHPVELAAQYKDNVLFAVTDQLIIKRLKFSDVMLKQATEDSAGEGVVAHFDATVALVAGELVELIGNLIKEIPADEDTTDTTDDEDEL